MSTHQLSAEMFGQGRERAGAETEFWAALPAMDTDTLESVVRRADDGDRFGILSAALKGGLPKPVADALLAPGGRFSDAEKQAMVKRQPLPVR